ncbi:hypothetical protein [Nocardioides gilvus]|uniref:hypothetical protein n=1 Tax=Nocardioides gilvus TaxID=1735589 RepID=UPI0013A5B331|nr:hypothetical protein [Nocardioides gilvus]
MRIHVWLEEREIAGLEPAFRATLELSTESVATPASTGCGSPEELHTALDRLLAEAGMVAERSS